MMQEFDLIKRFFNAPTHQAEVVVGSGDDAAILQWGGAAMVVTTDSLVLGTHFFTDTPPEALGYKSLAVNLSDLAAMGAHPVACLLSLTLPSVDEAWLQAFSHGFYSLAAEVKVDLVGGNIAQGPLNIGVTAFGKLTFNQALLRSGAKLGDRIYVSGTLGDAGYAVSSLLGKVPALLPSAQDFILSRWLKPTARVVLGEKLLTVASSCIDISDGLVQDLQHLLFASRVGAKIDANCLPLSSALVTVSDAKRFALFSGENYELCFTVPPEHEAQLKQLAPICRLTKIGEITAENHCEVLNYGGPWEAGFQHFRCR